MSLLRTLATVAVGVAAARGARSLANRGSRREEARDQGGLLDSLRGHDNSGGGLGALLGGGGAASGGGLGELLEEFGGSGALGGLGGMLGGGAAGGALGGLLGGGNRGGAAGFGRRLNQSLASGGEPEDAPTDDEEAMAALMIRAMIMAAKSDGRIDGEERAMLTDRLGDLSAQERRFVEEELNARIDVRDFARDVPDHPGLKAQIFAAAMSAIDVDSPREREFAEDLAAALGLEEKARGHVQRRMSGGYGQQPDGPWQKQDIDRAYSQPIQAPSSAGGPVRGTKGMQGNAGMGDGTGRPYRK
ncbi:tellurite resistance TerB family protein [Rhodobacteraceae bacterium M385]|nr:tellurite resistance TerB family protein [Rhodobacteraceae bacterium M385]